MRPYSDSRFKQQVASALKTVEQVLHINKHPRLPGDVNHNYIDKFQVVELLGSIALASTINSLEYLGLSAESLQKLKQWSSNQQITLRLKSEEKCVFDREVKRDVENVHSSHGSTNFGVTHKTVTTITEFFWIFTVNYELFAFQGTNADDKITLKNGTGTTELKTTVNATPRPVSTVYPNVDILIGWLLGSLKDDLSLNFSINRTSKKCRTPRRNPVVEKGIEFFMEFYLWAQKVENYITQLIAVEPSHHSTNQFDRSMMFVPVMPLFDRGRDKKTSDAIVLKPTEVSSLIQEQHNSLKRKFDQLKQTFPDNKKVITHHVGGLKVVALHIQDISQYFYDGVNYIEDLLMKQLIGAIGKVVTPLDFQEYMLWHNNRIFRKEYAPKNFAFPIRLPDHYPEGVISIDMKPNGGISQPIRTLARHGRIQAPIKFPINAATNVTLGGDLSIHSFVSYQFEDDPGATFKLRARTRQFSCFIFMVGSFGSNTLFLPKCAVLLRNKDDLNIPLTFEQIPTPKAFKDAIESLSPEQKRFAQAYRSMQLAGSLFGVCAIHMKPQLEKLLRLPYDGLTKEIRLTQDLLDLFLDYAIPSDLLSYDGPLDAPLASKLQRVKENVGQIQGMIQAEKDEELRKKREEEEAKRLLEQQLLAERRAKEQAERESQERELVGAIRSSNFSLRSAPTMEKSYQARTPLPQKMAAPRSFSSSNSALPQLSSLDNKPNLARKSKSAAPPAAPLASLAPKPVAPQPVTPQPVATQSVAPQVTPQPVATQPVATQPVATQPVALQSDSKPADPTPQDPKPEPVDSTEIVAKKEMTGDVESDSDFTKLPGVIDARFEEYDEDASLHATIIDVGDKWTKRSQDGLLSQPKKTILAKEQQKLEENKAFDLLDALSRSGGLSCDFASMHVVLASTHCFEKSLLHTVIQDNVNPIEKCERSVLILASTILGQPVQALLKDEHEQQVLEYSPKLIEL